MVLGSFSEGPFMVVINGLHGYYHLCFTQTKYDHTNGPPDHLCCHKWSTGQFYSWTIYVVTGQLGSSHPQGQGEEANEEYYVELLDKWESLELVQFDPMVEDENAWEEGEIINSFIEKHFKCAITMEERKALMKDFRNSCPALQTLKIDDDIKKQIKQAGKDPHFRVEKSLYKLQEQTLGMTDLLTCLWADLLNKDATVKPEDMILLLQRVLVPLRSASHKIF